jgi:hypothetical protein
MKRDELDEAEGEDVILRFTNKTVVEVFEHEDTDLHKPVEEIFDANEEIEVAIFGVDEHNLSVQFGDGSVAFIHRSFVQFMRFA